MRFILFGSIVVDVVALLNDLGSSNLLHLLLLSLNRAGRLNRAAVISHKCSQVRHILNEIRYHSLSVAVSGDST